ncbi:acetyltransferase, gnat family [Oceaniovalibus guishaninsula JLT2003]|uniref:Acetyltransferase, gnat family n=1 Tax=Oceaniovalibus guishaninsula JLT2003 TaxID=1231392 RepID=K2HAN1_9RHOB|nr:GNAT family N-acetyltransferase [Oceaniovalibus guishaninsula]EKE43717.1 acetyltransferase, gnat family [Oceaniovalibus guishaninsula JLT2003]
MRLRPATQVDLPALETLLATRLQTSIFPLANLRAHGLDGTAPRALRIHITDAADGMVAVSTEGMVFPQLPDPASLPAAAMLLPNRPMGLIGPAGQVRALLRAAGLDARPTAHDADEPGFALDLTRWTPPAPRADLALVRADTPQQVAAMVAMRRAYEVETGVTPTDVESTVAGYVRADSHRLLLLEGAPVGMTGFNAVVDDAVQVGGVHILPPYRNRGLARRMVALHLAQARSAGAARAFLFAASESAARAYTAIGFRPADPIALVFFA